MNPFTPKSKQKRTYFNKKATRRKKDVNFRVPLNTKFSKLKIKETYGRLCGELIFRSKERIRYMCKSSNLSKV